MASRRAEEGWKGLVLSLIVALKDPGQSLAKSWYNISRYINFLHLLLKAHLRSWLETNLSVLEFIWALYQNNCMCPKTCLPFPYLMENIWYKRTQWYLLWTECMCPPQIHSLKVKEIESEVTQYIRLFATPWTVAYQAPLSMGFSWQ